MANEILYPPLARIAPDDQRGFLWIIAILCLLFVWLTLAARCYVRWRRFQPDDYAILAACAVGLSQFTVIFAALAIGLGATPKVGAEDTIKRAWRLFVSSEALFVIVIFLSKIAVVLTIDNLLAGDMKLNRMVSRCTLAVIGLLGVASLLCVTIHCDLNSLFTPILTDRCTQTPRWVAIEAADACTELWILGFICSIVWSLKMKTRFKWPATWLFMPRIFCIVFASLHAYYMSTFVRSTNPSVGIVPSLVWQQLALGYSLVSALALALKPFLKDFHTGMGMDIARMGGTITSNSYSKGRRADAYKLHNVSVMSRDKDMGDVIENDGGDLMQNKENYQPDQVQYSASISHPKAQRQPSRGSSRSQHPIIKRDVDFAVSYESS